MSAMRTKRMGIVRSDDGHARRRHEPRSRVCLAEGCKNDTSEGKERCIEHLKDLPYVEKLSTLLARKEHEANVALTDRAAIDVSGPMADEILTRLAIRGPLTMAQVAKDVEATPSVVESYADALEDAGLAQRIETFGARGKRTTRLLATEAGKARVSVGEIAGLLDDSALCASGGALAS